VHGGCATIKSHCPRCVCVCVSGGECAVSIQHLQHIRLYVPFRVTTGTIQYVTRECTVSTFPKCLADCLRFFTGNQYIHSSSIIPRYTISACVPSSITASTAAR
jgi:hypothetical protein